MIRHVLPWAETGGDGVANDYCRRVGFEPTRARYRALALAFWLDLVALHLRLHPYFREDQRWIDHNIDLVLRALAADGNLDRTSKWRAYTAHMCGICGMTSLDGGQVDPGVLEAMNETLFHRGPDSGGTFVDRVVGLAARRLAIIDLAGGDQPISNEDGTIWVVQNGEIYNYRELRRRPRAERPPIHDP